MFQQTRRFLGSKMLSMASSKFIRLSRDNGTVWVVNKSSIRIVIAI